MQSTTTKIKAPQHSSNVFRLRGGERGGKFEIESGVM